MGIKVENKNEQVDKFTAKKYDGMKCVSWGSLIINHPDDGSPFGLIENVFTIKEFRGRGYATQIVKNLIELGKRHNCYKIILYCKDEHLSMYEKIGFEKNQNTLRLKLY